MSEWRTYRIAALGRIVTGKTPPSSQPELFDGQIPFITPSDMSYDHRDISTERFVSADWGSGERTLLPARAVCVVCIGATIGKICMTSKPSQTNQQLNSVIVDHEHFDQIFVYYALRMKVGELVGRAAGAATPIINKTAFSEVEIDAPNLVTQRRIASILGAYDDLIQVNRRRIAVLEEMARGLFEEWFVRFRFPGHEAARIEDTSNGPLPRGWSWGRFDDLASEIRDTILPQAVDPTTPYIGLEHISRRSTTLAEHGLAADASSLKARFRRGDILFGKIRPYFHKVTWAPFDGVASTDAIVWRPVRGLAAQALLQASSDAFVAHSVQTSNGTKMPRANNKVLAAYPCALAPSNISDRFENAVLPMIESAASFQAANSLLAASRDLLLPRLMSGQLSVAQAERELEAA